MLKFARFLAHHRFGRLHGLRRAPDPLTILLASLCGALAARRKSEMQRLTVTEQECVLDTCGKARTARRRIVKR